MEWFVMQHLLVERYHLYRHCRFKPRVCSYIFTLLPAKHLIVFAAVHTTFTYNDQGKETELYDFSCAQAEIVLLHRMHQLA